MMREVRVGFYPCCGRDISLPRELLMGQVDRIYFCDLDPTRKGLVDRENKKNPTLPEGVFVEGDAMDVIVDIKKIDVLFHRNDSWGEGGSGVPVLSDSFLSLFVERMPESGGQIYTDGSNSLHGCFERISRPTGADRVGCYFTPIGKIECAKTDPLWIISALPI